MARIPSGRIFLYTVSSAGSFLLIFVLSIFLVIGDAHLVCSKGRNLFGCMTSSYQKEREREFANLLSTCSFFDSSCCCIISFCTTHRLISPHYRQHPNWWLERDVLQVFSLFVPSLSLSQLQVTRRRIAASCSLPSKERGQAVWPAACHRFSVLRPAARISYLATSPNGSSTAFFDFFFSHFLHITPFNDASQPLYRRKTSIAVCCALAHRMRSCLVKRISFSSRPSCASSSFCNLPRRRLVWTQSILVLRRDKNGTMDRIMFHLISLISSYSRL